MAKELLLHLQEASKILHMDASHSALREKLQIALSAHHRAENPDSASYYDTPYVRDVYGDNESGQVVYSTKGNHSMADYKHDGTKATLSNHKPVKPAYVQSKESFIDVVYIDGKPITLAAKEAQEGDIDGDLIDLREAAFDAKGHGELKIIAPGLGSIGYYSPEVLKQAAKDKVFPANTQMHLDHQTESESAARPEGSVTTLAAVLTGDAVYHENGKEGPGLYAPVKAVADMKDFLNNRASIMGASIRARGVARPGVVNGKVTNIVEKLVVGRSIDFVTRAGAGGKLVSLLESYRATTGQQRLPASQENEVAKIEIEDSELKELRESAKQVPALKLVNDRNSDRLNRLEAAGHVATMLKESKIPAPSQNRLAKMLLAPESTIPVTEAGALDLKALAAKVKDAVTEEVAYLKESGLSIAGVTNLGSDGKEIATEAPKDFDTVLKESDGQFKDDIALLSGTKKKEGAAA